MKLVEINAVHHGSTGKIMLHIAKLVKEKGGVAYTFSGVRKVTPPAEHQYFGTSSENLLHRAYSVLTGISGTGSRMGTRKLLQQFDVIQPDVIHLHNLHGWYINLPMLFDYIKKNHIKTVWTLHDCWAFTAQCSYFTIEQCDKWKTGCYSCPRYRVYPYTFVDGTKKMWKLKKKWFSGIENMTIVTPSKWLGELVKQSYLKDYPVKVIYNGIDLDVFRPQNSDFREKYHIPAHKSILLGVAFGWRNQKGLDVFIELANCLDSDRYQIVLVGTDDKVDKLLPTNIISIHRTQNQQELAEIYSAADLFVNPTREEVLGMVNIESLACGTPVITFRTGGSQEIPCEHSGCVVPYNDKEAMKKEIIRICSEHPYTKEACIERAGNFHYRQKYEEYFQLYQSVLDQEVSAQD